MNLGSPPGYALCIILLLFYFVHTSLTATWESVDTLSEEKIGSINEFMRYGLLQNASMFIHVEMVQRADDHNKTMTLLICSEDDNYIVKEDLEICARLYYGIKPCKITQTFNVSLRLYYYFEEFGEYYFNLVKCKGEYAIDILIHLELENPNGNKNLSSSLVPTPTMFLLLAILWACVLLIWLFVAAPKWKNMSPLQYTMLTYPVLKIVSSAISAQYFYSYRVHDVSLFSDILYGILLIIVLLDFHYVLLLLSKAWSISGFLDKSDYHLMFSMLVGLCCSLMFKFFYDDSDLTFLLASLAYIGLRVMILACVFININHTIGRLESEMLNYNAEQESVNIRPTVVKLHKIFVLIKFALMLWVILNVAEFFCNILFFGGSEANWIDLMNTEFIDFLLSLCIGILLLPNVSLQIEIAPRISSRHALSHQSNNQNTDEDQNDNPTENEPTAGHNERPSTPNEDGELELTTFASRPSLSPSTLTPTNPLLTPESILPNGLTSYQKYPAEDDEEEYMSDNDEVQLVDKRRGHVQ